MADATLETVAQALDLLPINSQGLVSVQDLRDIVNSLVVAGSGKWTDLQGSILQAGGSSALTEETYRDTPFRSFFLRHDQADELSHLYQFDHAWALNGVRPHWHIEPMAAGSGNLVLSGALAWLINGEAAPAYAAWTPFAITKALTAADQYKPTIISFPDPIMPPVNVHPSAMLQIYWKRDTALDTYETSKPTFNTFGPQTAAANVRIISFDTHYRGNGLGTQTEF